MRRWVISSILVGGAALTAGALALVPPSPDPVRAAATGPAGAPHALAAADVSRGEVLFRTCAGCHTVDRGGADVDGPNLYGVVGAGVAARRPRYGYTQALRDAGGVWTGRRLDAWLTDPAAFAPGTAMHFPGLPAARDRADVVAYLATQGPAGKR